MLKLTEQDAVKRRGLLINRHIMVAIRIFLLHILLFLLGTNGLRFRSQCYPPFHCDDGGCIRKNEWCDTKYDCGDGSDEKYCYSGEGCNADIHFRCADGSQCIPIEGYCDGYDSCADSSDELDCPCKLLSENQGFIQFEASIGHLQTHHECWELLAEDGQDVEVSVRARLYKRSCDDGSISLTPLKSKKVNKVLSRQIQAGNPTDSIICADDGYEHFSTFKGSVRIRYRSRFYTSNYVGTDFFNITYSKVDPDCLLAEAFKCSPNSCIEPTKWCDGKRDCENGLDEQNCDFSAIATTYFKNSRRNATRWLTRQRNADWGWRSSTPKAVTALCLSGTFETKAFEDELTAKQLELEMSSLLLRSEEEKISPAELSTYINALLLICHDPRNFYGFDLVQKLREELKNISGQGFPLPYLTLCSTKADIMEEDIDRLFEMLQTSTTSGGFILEVQALALMALSCISRNEQYAHLKLNITEHVKALKKEQKEDGSFGNECTTALVLQALIANNETNDRDWNFKSSLEFLRRKQRADGSFGDFLTTYLVIPILNGKSLVDIGLVNCTEHSKRPREGSLVTDIKTRLGDKISVKYSLYIGDDKDQIHPIVLRTPKNVTAFELMTLAADIDPKYKFKTHEIRRKTYVYEISNVPNDPESNKFWFIYRSTGNTTTLTPSQSPDEVRVTGNENIIMWYKTLHIM